MKVNCAHAELVATKGLKPHPKNPNRHPAEQIERLAKIIEFQGWRHPIIVSKRSGFIVAGHARWEAAKKLKLKQVPVDFQDFADDQAEYAFLVSDNAIAEFWSATDLASVNLEIGDLGPDFDIDLLGIKDFTLDVAEKLEPGCEPDEAPALPKEAKSKIGDLWTLGRHRLLCGDSTDILAVDRLFGDDRADITFTSPPYNAGKQGFLQNISKQKYLAGDDARCDEDYINLLRDFTSIAMQKSTYVFVNLQLLSHNRIPLIDYQHTYREFLKDILVWVKTQCPPNIIKGAFNTKWEYIFCFSNDSRTRGFPVKWQGQYANVVETESNSGNEFAEVHKAGFPVAFPSWLLEKFDFAQTVYEPFCGTGTTIIACERLDRRCLAIELDPRYVDVILSRFAKYSGTDPVRDDGVTWSSLNG